MNNNKFTPIIEIETEILKKILDSNKYKNLHDEIKKELNFRDKNFDSNLINNLNI